MRTLLAALALLSCSPAAAAQDEAAALARAGGLGATLYAHDRAAWVSTDALRAKLPKERLAEVRGWVIEIAGDTLTVTYFRGTPESAEGVFVAHVRDGKVVDASPVETPAPLTVRQKQFATAVRTAASVAVREQFRPCTAGPFNTVVIPSRRDGPVAVYLLSPQVEAKTYPLGGHYRVLIGQDGSVMSHRPYTRSCLNMALPEGRKGSAPAGLMVSSLLDPLPTELHVFSSYATRMPIYVATPDKRFWSVFGSTIRAVKAPR